MTEGDKAQLEKFKEAAREHAADEDETRWDERLKKVAKPRSAEKKPNSD